MKWSQILHLYASELNPLHPLLSERKKASFFSIRSVPNSVPSPDNLAILSLSLPLAANEGLFRVELLSDHHEEFWFADQHL